MSTGIQIDGSGRRIISGGAIVRCDPDKPCARCPGECGCASGTMPEFLSVQFADQPGDIQRGDVSGTFGAPWFLGFDAGAGPVDSFPLWRAKWNLGAITGTWQLTRVTPRCPDTLATDCEYVGHFTNVISLSTDDMADPPQPDFSVLCDLWIHVKLSLSPHVLVFITIEAWALGPVGPAYPDNYPGTFWAPPRMQLFGGSATWVRPPIDCNAMTDDGDHLILNERAGLIGKAELFAGGPPHNPPSALSLDCSTRGIAHARFTPKAALTALGFPYNTYGPFEADLVFDACTSFGGGPTYGPAGDGENGRFGGFLGVATANYYVINNDGITDRSGYQDVDITIAVFADQGRDIWVYSSTRDADIIAPATTDQWNHLTYFFQTPGGNNICLGGAQGTSWTPVLYGPVGTLQLASTYWDVEITIS